MAKTVRYNYSGINEEIKGRMLANIVRRSCPALALPILVLFPGLCKGIIMDKTRRTEDAKTLADMKTNMVGPPSLEIIALGPFPDGVKGFSKMFRTLENRFCRTKETGTRRRGLTDSDAPYR